MDSTLVSKGCRERYMRLGNKRRWSTQDFVRPASDLSVRKVVESKVVPHLLKAGKARTQFEKSRLDEYRR